MKKLILLGLVIIIMSACAALGIQSEIEKTRQKALANMEKAVCADIQETKAFLKGSKLEAIDWEAICQ